MNETGSTNGDTGISRRNFLAAASAIGAQAALSRAARSPASGRGRGDVQVALIGTGVQGSVLLNHLVKMEGVRVRAVCDIWPYRRDRAWQTLAAYKHEADTYAHYKELLTNVKGLDAAIVATPDWMHAEHSIACMQAGLCVYCEMPISHDLGQARRMIATARRTGRLLQIGHQRRSNPLYRQARNYLRGKRALGRITHVEAHCHRYNAIRLTWPRRAELDRRTLRVFGYDTMERLRNWRWYRTFSSGPVGGLGAQQLDVLNWFLQAAPRSVQAIGGNESYKQHEWYDNVSVLLAWDCAGQGAARVVRGIYQILNTTGHGHHFETFLGDEGSMVLSQSPRVGCGIRREGEAPTAGWERSKEINDALSARGMRLRRGIEKDRRLRLGEIEPVHLSEPPPDRVYPIPMPEGWQRPPHRWHLENFLAAVRDPKKVHLNCPGEVALASCVLRRAIHEAMEAHREVILTADQFQA